MNPPHSNIYGGANLVRSTTLAGGVFLAYGVMDSALTFDQRKALDTVAGGKAVGHKKRSLRRRRWLS